MESIKVSNLSGNLVYSLHKFLVKYSIEYQAISSTVPVNCIRFVHSLQFHMNVQIPLWVMHVVTQNLLQLYTLAAYEFS